MKIWMAPAGFHIEPAAIGDADAIARLHGESFFRGWPESEFTSYIGDPDRTPAYVAVDAKRRLGGFAILRLAGDEAELLTIAVDRKWRGKKLGRALIIAALDDLRMSAARALFLEVDDGNQPAIALYKGFGFAEIGRRQAYYPKPGGEAATALVMRRALD